MEECAKFINLRREAYYIKVKSRQKAKAGTIVSQK